jgi:ligand-binding sensor domain-containing protein
MWLTESNTSIKINDVAQDNKGYIWLATDAGLYKFNGRNFKLIPDSIKKPVSSVCSHKDAIYIGYATGNIGYVYEERVHPIDIHNHRPTKAINKLYTDGSGVLWACTEDGLFIINHEYSLLLNKQTGLTDNYTYDVLSIGPGKILVATDIGLTEYDLEKIKNVKHYTTRNGLPDNIVRVLKPFAKEEKVWLGTQQSGIAIFDKRSRTISTPKYQQPWTWGQINDILVINENKMWVATEEGYALECQYHNDTLKVNALQLEGKKISRLTMGKSGIIWCATNQGITMLTAEYMNYIPLPTPYRLSAITAMACDKKNVMWVALNHSLYSYSLRGGELKQRHTLPVNITALYCDEMNRIWIGTLGKGLWYVDELGALKKVLDIPILQNESVLDVTGTDDRLWVAGLNGVEELSYPGMFTGKITMLKLHNKVSGIGSDYVYQIYADKKNRIWMATDGAGICMYNNGVYKHWDSTTGFQSKVVYGVTEDGNGNIWVATLDNGLFVYNTYKWDHLTRTQGLQDINISAIDANKTGQVFVVNRKGIDVWYPMSKQFRNYNNRQMLNIDSVSPVLKLSARDMNGNVYIPFSEGLIIFKNLYNAFDIRPTTHISSISVFFKDIKLGTQEFPYDKNHISFKFEGVNFANPERLHYRYKLEGYGDSWIVTNDESVTFPQLGTGNYTFRVQASLNNLFSSYGEASYSFSIGKPFWWRTWFIFAVLFAIVGGVYLYIKIREKNLQKVSSLQRERMVFEYEHLKSQVNPHFLFNSLNTLSTLIDENQDAAVNYTERLSDLYRNMLNYRDKDLIILSEELEILENYIYIQRYRFGDALRLVLNISEHIRETREIVPLALQLLVENAIKHNIVSTARPLIIIITATEDEITISNPLQSKISKEKGAGLGLVNIKKRYSLLTKRNITIETENKYFIVKLPLL